MDKKFVLSPKAEILPAKDDQIFKSLLTRNEPESKIVLMDIISSVIERKVTDVVIKNNEPATMDITQKQERLDINCSIDNGDIVNIEMQSSYMKEFFNSEHKSIKNRSVFYACDLFSSQSIKGKSYSEIDKTYQITFVAYTVFSNIADYKNVFNLKNASGNILTDDLVIIFIELSKLKEILKKPVETMSPLEMWSIFFEYVDNPYYRNIINDMINVREEIGMASALLQSISQDDYEKARLMSRRKYETDLESNMLTAIKNTKIELAINLLDVLDIDTIANKTGLTVEDVKQLKEKSVRG